MQVFCRVIDCQGFAAAARSLDMSPPVVTRLISDLEAHLGARLLNRSTSRKLVLTEAGEIYLEQVRHILADIAEAESSVQSATRALCGRLKVLAPPTFATHELVRHVLSFRRAYPKVQIDLVTSGQVETLDEGFDLCLLMGHEGGLEGDFVARRLARTRLIVVASPAYLNQHGRPQHPRELAQHEWLVPTFVRELNLRHLDHRAGEGSQSHVLSASHSALLTSHLETVRSAALEGVGLAVLPSFAAAQSCQKGDLQRVLPAWGLNTMSIYAAIPTRQHVPAKTRAFMDHLTRAFPDGERDPWIELCSAGPHTGQLPAGGSA